MLCGPFHWTVEQNSGGARLCSYFSQKTPSCVEIVAKMATPSPIPAGISKEQAFSMAQTEMEYRVELFNKLAQTCFRKCVDNRYKEAELNMGDNSCIDRCVSKYWQVNGMVGQLLSVGKPPM
ncbi:hypothetical protein Rs2_17181 [Raphanus sativus]|nr:hypothetical protein Rs2_17181 [Raphanus sativus]